MMNYPSQYADENQSHNPALLPANSLQEALKIGHAILKNDANNAWWPMKEAAAIATDVTSQGINYGGYNARMPPTAVHHGSSSSFENPGKNMIGSISERTDHHPTDLEAELAQTLIFMLKTSQ